MRYSNCSGKIASHGDTRHLSWGVVLFPALGLLPGLVHSAPAPSGAEDAPAALEEVIVTAQKRSENVQDVPSSITVLGGDKLEQMAASQLTDYIGYIPGMATMNGGTPGQNLITLRGITARTGSATVGTYIDDTPFGSSSAHAQGSLLGLDVFPYDIERIEVLRGPQGTLYGASTMGGLLKYVLRSPDLYEFAGRAGAETSTTSHSDDLGWAVRAGLNAPLIEGKLALRGSVFNQESAGFIDNALGRKDENGSRQRGARLALLWQATDALSLKLTAMYQDIDLSAQAQAMFAADLQPIYGNLTSRHVLPEHFNQELGYYAATLTWDLGSATFTSASSYSRTETRIGADATADFGPLLPFLGAPEAAFADLQNTPRVRKYTQEFRLASASGQQVEWLVGAFYTDESAQFTQRSRAFDVDRSIIPGLDIFFGTLDTKYREVAAFGNLTYRFTDRFDVTAGLRWAYNEQDFAQISGGALLGGVSTEALGDSSDSVVTYSIAPKYSLNEDTMIYARVASSYRAGGPNIRLPGVPSQFDADTLVNYELGLKSNLLQRRASIDLSVFHIDWKDMQSYVPGSAIAYIGNSGGATSQGVELATVYSPVPGLMLGLNGAYTDSSLDQDVPSLNARAGDEMPFIAKWSGSATANYEFALTSRLSARLGAGYRYTGSRFADFESAPGGLPLKAAGMLDLNASLFNDRWELRLYARNLTDERSISGGSLRGTAFIGSVNQPRTIGIGLDAKF